MKTISKAIPRPCNVALNTFACLGKDKLDFEFFLASSLDAGGAHAHLKYSCFSGDVLRSYIRGACVHDQDEIKHIRTTSPAFSIERDQDAAITHDGFCLYQVVYSSFWRKVTTPQVLFSELAAKHDLDRFASYSRCEDAAVCTWYGGELFYAAPGGLDELIGTVCAERPAIAARQIEYNMRNRIQLTSSNPSDGTEPSIRKRMRI